MIKNMRKIILIFLLICVIFSFKTVKADYASAQQALDKLLLEIRDKVKDPNISIDEKKQLLISYGCSQGTGTDTDELASINNYNSNAKIQAILQEHGVAGKVTYKIVFDPEWADTMVDSYIKSNEIGNYNEDKNEWTFETIEEWNAGKQYLIDEWGNQAEISCDEELYNQQGDTYFNECFGEYCYIAVSNEAPNQAEYEALRDNFIQGLNYIRANEVTDENGNDVYIDPTGGNTVTNPSENQTTTNTPTTNSPTMEFIKQKLQECKERYEQEYYKTINNVKELEGLGTELRVFKERYTEELDMYRDKLIDEGLNPQIIDQCINMINRQIQRLEYTVQTPEGMVNQAQEFVNQTPAISLNEIAGSIVPIGKAAVAIALVILLIVTIIMGIKYTMADPQSRGHLKQQLVGLVISTFVVFGAYALWDFVYRLVVAIFE